MSNTDDKFIRSISIQAMAHVSMALGVGQATLSCMNTLADVVEEHILQLGRAAHDSAERSGRSEVNLVDVLSAFAQQPKAVQWRELRDFAFADLMTMEAGWDQPFHLSVPAVPFAAPAAAPSAGKQGDQADEPAPAQVTLRPPHVPEFLPSLPPASAFDGTGGSRRTKEEQARMRRKRIIRKQQAEKALWRVSKGTVRETTKKQEELEQQQERWGELPRPFKSKPGRDMTGVVKAFGRSRQRPEKMRKDDAILEGYLMEDG